MQSQLQGEASQIARQMQFLNTRIDTLEASPSPRGVQQQSVAQSVAQAAPQVVPQTVPQALPQSVPQGMPQMMLEPVPQSMRQTMPQTAPLGALQQPMPQFIPQTALQAMSQAVPQAVPVVQTMPQMAPQSVPQGVPQWWSTLQGYPQQYTPVEAIWPQGVSFGQLQEPLVWPWPVYGEPIVHVFRMRLPSDIGQNVQGTFVGCGFLLDCATCESVLLTKRDSTKHPACNDEARIRRSVMRCQQFRDLPGAERAEFDTVLALRTKVNRIGFGTDTPAE